MDKAILDIVQGGLTLESLVLVLQLIVAAFFVLAIKSWIVKTWAWRTFKGSTVLGVGSLVVVCVNGTYTFEGEIISANKGRVAVSDGEATVFVPTSEFVKRDWTVKKVPQGAI
jgi:hypothetical protein